MPNLNATNNERNNSFYAKEILSGTITATAGLLLTGLSLSIALSFYDNTKNSNSLTDKLNTLLNVNNLAISTLVGIELNIGLELMTCGRKRINQACKGLRSNLTASSAIPLLTSDNIIEEINNRQEITYQNEIVTVHAAAI